MAWSRGNAGVVPMSKHYSNMMDHREIFYSGSANELNHPPAAADQLEEALCNREVDVKSCRGSLRSLKSEVGGLRSADRRCRL